MGKTHTIGVVIPFFTTASQIERLRGVMSVIASSDYDISLFAIETVAQRNKVLQTVPVAAGLMVCLSFPLIPLKTICVVSPKKISRPFWLKRLILAYLTFFWMM